jgi:hypothetical protein
MASETDNDNEEKYKKEYRRLRRLTSSSYIRQMAVSVASI